MFDGILNAPLLWLRDNLFYENKLLVVITSVCDVLFSATMNMFLLGYFNSIF